MKRLSVILFLALSSHAMTYRQYTDKDGTVQMQFRPFSLSETAVDSKVFAAIAESKARFLVISYDAKGAVKAWGGFDDLQKAEDVYLTQVANEKKLTLLPFKLGKTALTEAKVDYTAQSKAVLATGKAVALRAVSSAEALKPIETKVEEKP